MKRALLVLTAIFASGPALARDIRGPEPHAFYFCGAAPGTPRAYLTQAEDLRVESGGCRFVPHTHELTIPKAVLDCPRRYGNDNVYTFETSWSMKPYPHRHKVKVTASDLSLVRQGLGFQIRDEDADHLFSLDYPGGINHNIPGWPNCD